MSELLVLEGHLRILNDWDDPYEVELDGEELVPLLVKHFGMEPDWDALGSDGLGLECYGPFDFGRVRITIERVEGE